MRLSFAFIFVLLITSSVLIADTINVPGDYPTILQGIDAAVNGDTVMVAPGTYVENIDFKGKAISVISSDGAEVTIIDGGSPLNPDFGSVVTFSNGEDLDSVLDGFTLTNGTGTYFESTPGYWYYYGGGIFCSGSSPIIANITITGNTASCHGGGICYFYSNSSPTITNATITGNTAGIYGGGIACMFSSPTIANITITGNMAGGDGGGISYWCPNSSPTITNATITGNTACGSGGGILSFNFSSPTITNTILWDNYAPIGPEIRIGDEGGIGSSLTISFSDMDGGSSSAHVEPGSILNWGPGMIDSDPLFVDEANGDYHLTFQSPCRGSGDNSAVTELYDFEGDPRIAYGTVDMGADEFYTHLYVTGDQTPGGSIQGKFVGLPGTNPVGLFIGSGVLPSPIPTMWGEYWLQSPWILLGPLGAIPSNGVMVLPTTLPPGMTAPVDIPMQALIGLNADSLSNLCVLEVR